jgi:hypothetical protein
VDKEIARAERPERESLNDELRRVRDGIHLRFFERLRREVWARKMSSASQVTGLPTECSSPLSEYSTDQAFISPGL